MILHDSVMIGNANATHCTGPIWLKEMEKGIPFQTLKIDQRQFLEIPIYYKNMNAMLTHYQGSLEFQQRI